MKILYGIQGTGNGHLTRANNIIKGLKKEAEVDILVSGSSFDITIDNPIIYRFKGLNINIDNPNLWQILKELFNYNFLDFYRNYKNINTKQYDLIISDYEPVSLYLARKANLPSISVCNQVSFFNDTITQNIKIPFLRNVLMKRFFLASDSINIGFHFNAKCKFIRTPIIRDEIRFGLNVEDNFGLVYLPHLPLKRLMQIFSDLNFIRWKIFTKIKDSFTSDSVEYYPMDYSHFTNNLLSSKFVISTAGFSTTTECLFLGKQLIVMPIPKHFEQMLNSISLKKIGIKIIKAENTNELIRSEIKKSLFEREKISINYPDNTLSICKQIIQTYIEIKNRY